jgi:hypothetical protein
MKMVGKLLSQNRFKGNRKKSGNSLNFQGKKHGMADGIKSLGNSN